MCNLHLFTFATNEITLFDYHTKENAKLQCIIESQSENNCTNYFFYFLVLNKNQTGRYLVMV